MILILNNGQRGVQVLCLFNKIIDFYGIKRFDGFLGGGDLTK